MPRGNSSRSRSVDPERSPLLPKTSPTQDELKAIDVFTLIHQLHDDVKTIDSALSWEQLNAPGMCIPPEGSERFRPVLSDSRADHGPLRSQTSTSPSSDLCCSTTPRPKTQPSVSWCVFVRLTYTTVLHATDKLSSVLRTPQVYALLLNRLHFMRLADADLSFQALQITRADLCEVSRVSSAVSR